MDGRGSIAFFGTYRPPVPLDIYSLPADPADNSGEQPLTDGKSSEEYNQNGRAIPAAALKELLAFLLKSNKQDDPAKTKDPNNGLEELLTFLRTRKDDDPAAKKVKGVIFVSERENGLETLHVALSWDGKPEPTVLSLADIYGTDTFGGVRMEDSGCFAGGFEEGGRAVGHSLIYVSTKEPVRERRTPWTVVYKTNLADGKTERLTPPDQYDLSPAVSPSGRKVAVANFQFHRWNGEIEHLKTDIVVMNVDRHVQGGLRREVVIKNAGWPTWGSDKVIFFHRGDTPDPTNNRLKVNWRVFRYDLGTGKEEPVTPAGIDAMTPAAISETLVAVAAIRQKSNQNVSVDARVEAQYRHIEIFDTTKPDDKNSTGITLRARGKADHYNPFVLDGGSRIGYHRCRTDKLVKLKPLDSTDDTLVAQNRVQKVQIPDSHKDVGLFRVSGVFPSFSQDGSKLAFVDNEFKAVWLADEKGMRVIYKWDEANMVFSTSWGVRCEKQKQTDGTVVEAVVETLFVCDGPGFSRDKQVDIKYLAENTSTEDPDDWILWKLTDGKFNNAFPSSSPDGKKLVFRSTRDRSEPGGNRGYTNLYILDAMRGESHANNRKALQLTDGPWVDTHCSWAPSGDWIVFASSRDKAPGAPDRDLLDAGFFSVYLISARGFLDPKNPNPSNEMPVPVRVIQSSHTFRGHVNHPVFSPDMRSIVFTSDLAGVSVEPISMPIFIHSVRPYGDIFAIDLRDKDDMAKNEDIREFHRITHSRYEYSTPAWTVFRPVDPHEKWNLLKTISNKLLKDYEPACPYLHAKDHEGWHMAGHLTMVTKRDHGDDDDDGYQIKPTRYC